jgi:hypothetical protein
LLNLLRTHFQNYLKITSHSRILAAKYSSREQRRRYQLNPACITVSSTGNKFQIYTYVHFIIINLSRARILNCRDEGVNCRLEIQIRETCLKLEVYGHQRDGATQHYHSLQGAPLIGCNCYSSSPLLVRAKEPPFSSEVSVARRGIQRCELPKFEIHSSVYLILTYLLNSMRRSTDEYIIMWHMCSKQQLWSQRNNRC